VQTAFHDPLRDEGRAYAARLEQAGVPVVHDEYADLSHGYFNVVGLLSCGLEPIDELGAFVRARFSPLS
jgi:acetyl esterase